MTHARLRSRRDPDEGPRRRRTGASRTTRRAAATQALQEDPRTRRSRPKHVIAELKKSALRGRGGAGFPTGLKWSFMPRQLPGREVRGVQLRRGRAGHLQGPRPPALQPAHRDRGHDHRRLRDGRDRRLQLHPRRDLGGLRAVRGGARRRRTPPGYLGKNILGSDFSFELYAHHGYGAYICGEETALLESLEGKKGMPRFKPPFPASYGLYGKPTTINNTETFAAVPWIMRNGGDAFLALGKPNNGGTKLFSVIGPRQPARQLRGEARHAVREAARDGGRHARRHASSRRVIPGGSSMPVLPGRRS